MDCPSEEALIRVKLGKMPAIVSMEFDLLLRVLIVEHEEGALPSIFDALRSLGFDSSPEKASEKVPKKRRIWPLALACVSAALSETASWLAQPSWVVAALALCAVAACGLTTYRKGIVAIRNGKLNINALMSIAVTGAILIGQWPEAAMVMTLFTIAELIEAQSLQRARNAIVGLMTLAPDTVNAMQPDGTWRDTDARAIMPCAIVRVKPGERIALDSVIVLGQSTIDQASITGESIPVEKTKGDAVYAGTINQTGAFEFRVTTQANDTTLARIVAAVEQAQSSKAQTQSFIDRFARIFDRFARIYTPAVLVIALSIAIVPLVLGWGAPLEWAHRALVLLVIACPCALLISTPVTIVSGLAAAARRGILIKGGMFLELGRKLDWLAIDKTGTLTHGKPVQTAFERVQTDDDDAHVRTLAASLAERSDHPVSNAITRAAEEDGVRLYMVKNFKARPGLGVRGTIAGRMVWLGNYRLMERESFVTAELRRRVEALEREGRTVVMLCDEQNVRGIFAVADTVRPTSHAAIARLHALGVRTAMLSGDNIRTAKAVARDVGIDRVEGDLMPEGKLRILTQMSNEGAVVGMVGDGINDTLALARADIGFAMGTMGSDTAIETADVALMDDDLRKIGVFIRLSKATHAILVQNIAFSLAVKAVFIALAVTGAATMWMAVFADVGASLTVVGNGLRLLRKHLG
nr:heavy metal translocating P-type ATPase [Candidatus Burkholderia verschuerenii]